MDSDQGKLFIGGISWETSEDRLKDYFEKYGEVLLAVIMKDKLTGRPRGFGFVVFADPSLLDIVLQDKHVIDDRTVEAKRALSREEQHSTGRSPNPNSGRSAGGGSGGNIRTKKIFVGGLPPTLTEDGFRQYFETYGTVTDVVVMYDQSTGRPRGFGFISFDSEEAVDRVLHKTFHDLSGKQVEVKRALPKDANSGTGGGRSMGGGGTYQSYGNSNGNANSYDGRLDTSRYMQPPTSGGGYPGYGSSAYGTPGYSYGAAGTGYGAYGMGGYGGPSGAYGNPNAPAGGYGNAQPGAPRSPWNNTGYGAAGSWNMPTAGGGGNSSSAATGQSPGGTGYGNQSYGYSSYGATDASSYGNPGGYGAVGLRGASGGPISSGVGTGGEGAGSGYMGGSYGDANGGGYPNSWRSDSSQGAYGSSQINGPSGVPAGYGGYGGALARQTQQQ